MKTKWSDINENSNFSLQSVWDWQVDSEIGQCLFLQLCPSTATKPPGIYYIFYMSWTPLIRSSISRSKQCCKVWKIFDVDGFPNVFLFEKFILKIIQKSKKKLIFSRSLSPWVEPELHHYTDFDCKVIDYMSRLERQDHVKTYVALAKQSRLYIEMIVSPCQSDNNNKH